MLRHSTVVFLSFIAQSTRASISESGFSRDRILTKDVAIIGGGASGAYAAVRLREDFNTSIAIVEIQSRLGGHVATYTVPETNSTVEFGVQSYIPYGKAKGFFDRFEVATAPFASRRLTNINVDIETGKSLADYSPPAANDTAQAFNTWLTIVEKYESFVEPGYWNFPSAEQIPADLLTPFGEFATKNGIEAAVPRIMAVSNVGVGGIKDILTLKVIQAFGAPITRSMLTNSLFIPVGSNSLLYQRAYKLLEQDVFLSSYVKEAERTTDGVKLVISGEDGDQLIQAKRLLITVPPSVHNLEPFSLDDAETNVFSSWTPTWSFIGVLDIPCIPENYSVSYLSQNAAPADHLAIRDWPYTLRFDSTGPSGLGLFRVLFATNFSITHEEAKQTITENVKNLVRSGTVDWTGQCNINFRAFVNHNSETWRHSAEQLKGGFVQDLNALQGRRSTWYTGGLWSSDYSSNVWAFTETVIPRLLEGLREGPH